MDRLAGSSGTSLPSRLPWPADWPRPIQPKSVLLVLAGAGFTIFDIGIGVLALTESDIGTGILLLLASPLMILATINGYLTRLRGRRRGMSAVRHGLVAGIDEPGLLIPYSRAVATTAVLVPVAVLLVTAPAMVLFLLALLVDGVHIEVLAPLAVFTAGTIYLVWLLAEVARKRLALGLLALTPSGVCHRSWAFRSYVPWTAITSVSTGQTREGPLITMAVFANTEPRFHQTSRLWKQDEFRLAPHIAIKTAYLAVDPALAYHALAYYHAHPNARPELATTTALDRLRTARLLPT
jgi:hypothetical protein